MRCIFLLYVVDNIISFWGKNVKNALSGEKNQLKIWSCQNKYIPLHYQNSTTKTLTTMARYEVYDYNDEVIDESDNLLNAQIAAEFECAKFILDTQTNEIVSTNSNDI